MERPGQARPAESLPKANRLAKRREFVRVYESGRKLFSKYTVLFFAPNGLTYSRLGITATKKLGKANVRNKLKRWTREVYRRERAPRDIDSCAVDVVVNLKPSATGASFPDFHTDLSRLLQRVVTESVRS